VTKMKPVQRIRGIRLLYLKLFIKF